MYEEYVLIIPVTQIQFDFVCIVWTKQQTGTLLKQEVGSLTFDISLS